MDSPTYQLALGIVQLIDSALKLLETELHAETARVIKVINL